jgi:hypothetical protein
MLKNVNATKTPRHQGSPRDYLSMIYPSRRDRISITVGATHVNGNKLSVNPGGVE